MPIFAVVPWIAAGVVAIVGAIVGKSIYDRIHDEGGKVVSVVGPRMTGKTSLTRYLAENVDLPLAYAPTQLHNEYEVEVSGVPFLLNVRDFGGGDDQVKEWSRSEAAQTSDEIWFIASAAQLADDDQRIKAETKARAVRSAQLKANVILVVTHSDLDGSFDGSRIETLAVSGEVQRLTNILGSSRTVVGSLCSNENAELLTGQLLGGDAL